MSKAHNTSYEGFRRKNSLNSLEGNTSSSASDLTFLKFKHNEHLSEVQNISIQLENFSKRSLSSRSFCEDNMKHSNSSSNIQQMSEGVTQNRFFHSSRKEESTPQRKVEFMTGKNERSLPKERKVKVSNSAIFNNFDIIQEDNYLNEQEDFNEIEPVTFKGNPTAKATEKKNTTKLTYIKPSINPTVKKTATIKIQNTGVKKQNLKLQLNELDKMQKQLDSKRSARENNTAKTTSSANIMKRGGKEALTIHLKEGGKISKSTANQLSDSSRAKQTKSSTTILLSAKLAESKQEIAIQQEKKECIPTRMLSQKEKSFLLQNVETLRQIIEKNDICAQNFNEITNYFGKIEKLLTK